MADPTATLTVTLQLATHPTQPAPSLHALTVARTSSIKDLKSRLANEWDGKPAVEGIVCVLGGRVCRDADVLGDLFPESTPAPPFLHVIVKSGAWTVPFTAPPALPPAVTPATLASPIPASTPTLSLPLPLPLDVDPAQNGYAPSYITPVPTTPSLGPSVSGYPTYLAFLSQLIPLQRALLLLNLQKAHFEYSEAINRRQAALGWGSEAVVIDPEQEGEDDVEEVKNLLTECGLWSIVRDQEDEAIAELEVWGAARVDPNGEFQVVQIGGLPFILHMPPGYLAPPPVPALKPYQSFRRAVAIHQILTTMLQLLMTYQPTSPAIAYGRALLRPATGAGAGAVAGGHHEHAPRGAAAAAPARRRATLSIVINLEAMLSILIPLLLLSLKLAFLLWIFGRHASASKRLALFVMAVAWVAWEGWVMQRRRAALGAGRDRLERANRRAAAAAAGAAPVGVPAAPRPAAADVPGAPPAAPRLPRADARQVARRPAPPIARPRTPREPVSRLSPRYWLNWVAAIGLAEEARELGLVPRTIAGRPVVAPPTSAPATARQRALRTALVAIVLFFGTLSPEVEKKRKRALEKRERLLAMRRANRERKAALVAAGAAPGPELPGLAALRGQAGPNGNGGSGASTPGVFEADDRSMSFEGAAPAPPPSAEAGPSTAIVPTSNDPTPTVELVPRPDAEPQPPAGRAVVTDAELFADGLGEPDQLGDLADHEAAIAEGRVEDTETDDEDEARRDQEDEQAEGDVDQIVALF